MEIENLNLEQNQCSETEINLDDDLKYEAIEVVDDRSSSDEEDDEEEEEEFSFVSVEADSSPTAADDLFVNGELRTIFPLFNRDLLFSGEDSGDLVENLPHRPPVKKIFVETGENCGTAVEASPEICEKSNSTGFSKMWRFKDLVGRSNSDGRDAFVFLNNGAAAAESTATTVKVKKSSRGKTAPLSPHEAYLKSKAKADGRRRSYLPYRPELMGFFTNVNGGLSKNVHPY